MKRSLSIYSQLLLGITVMIVPMAHALIGPATTIGGPATTTTSKAVQTNSQAYLPASGSFFIGLAAGAGNNAISYASRPASSDTVPTFTGIAGSSMVNDAAINQLTLVQNSLDRTNPAMAYLLFTTAFTAANTVYIMTATAQNNNPQTAVLKDASNTAVTGNIMGLVGGIYNTTSYAFVAVKANSGGGNFGAATVNDGISMMSIDPITLAPTVSPTILARASAALGVFATGANATTLSSVSDRMPMVYDEIFNKFYISLRSVTSNTTAGSAATTVATYMIDTSVTPAVLQNVPMSGPNATGAAPLSTVFNTSNTNILGVTSPGGTRTVSAYKMAIMRTSTQPAADKSNYAYLIINGGNGTAFNTVYAVPLVVNNAISTNNGKLADVTNPGTYPFDTPANAANRLYTTTSRQACVGNGSFPAPTASQTIRSMSVQGDTVYVSISGSAAVAGSYPALYKSQALFDQNGCIASWTDWEKVTPGGYAADPNLATSIYEFAVDACTGQIWAVNFGSTSFNSNIFLTGWTKSAIPTNGLVGFLNSNLSDGCFSVLDMNASVTGWGASTSQRMALFGGEGKVCFAITGSAVYGLTTTPILSFSNGPASSLTSTATSVVASAYSNTLSNYTSTTNNVGLVTTGLPSKVVCLGYSGWNAVNASNTTPAFFLAGIQPEADEDGSVYAYATSNGRGFNPATQITDLKNGFFLPSNQNSWQRLSNVKGTPVKIMSRGGGLYILTQSVTDEGRTDYIYRATICDTITNLNNSFIPIATSGLAPSGSNSSLAQAQRFYDFMITSTIGGTTVAPTGTEQLMVLTNDGIYTTTSVDGTQKDYGPTTTAQTLQLNAGWTQIPDSDGYVEMFVTEPDRQRSPSSYWASRFVPDANGYYNNQIMTQMCSSYTSPSGVFHFNPSSSKAGMFNSDLTTTFTTLPLMTGIYSDGNRRFFVQMDTLGKQSLVALPYKVGPDAWNVTDPRTPINSTAFADVTAYYWMAQIGSTGFLMVGTDTGVVSLQ